MIGGKCALITESDNKTFFNSGFLSKINQYLCATISGNTEMPDRRKTSRKQHNILKHRIQQPRRSPTSHHSLDTILVLCLRLVIASTYFKTESWHSSTYYFQL